MNSGLQSFILLLLSSAASFWRISDLHHSDAPFSLQVLLLDLPAPILQPQEKLLIDLTNTPNLIRTSNKTCTTSQVTDTSPCYIHKLKAVFLFVLTHVWRGLLNKTYLLVFSTRLLCLFQQLIDLSSPLIKWSPEDKRENNAPLINLSF